MQNSNRVYPPKHSTSMVQSYPEQAREIARKAAELSAEGVYGDPDAAILAMLDGDCDEDRRLNKWFVGDDSIRYDVYMALDNEIGIDEEYANAKANEEYPTKDLHTDGRFPEPESMNDKAKIKFYYGVYDVMSRLAEEEAEKMYEN